MALVEAAPFSRDPVDVEPAALAAVLARHARALNAAAWIYCGYTPLQLPDGVSPPAADVSAAVNNQLRLTGTLGFERSPLIVTCGLRGSRFAPVLFWELLHLVARGGTWIDIDIAARSSGTPLDPADYMDRQYFARCLTREAADVHDSLRTATYRKTAPTLIAAGIADAGWTFGILTAGPSPTGARMARAILSLDLPAVEVIFCGPRPAGVPDDPRVRSIDLDAPEPRGWITRKKNLLAAAAAYEGLCLVHDRYEITPGWAHALKEYGPCCAVTTLPHVHFPDYARRFPQRYPDYQLLDQRQGLAEALAANVYNADRIFHPAYEDFAETAFCCGGLYVTRRSLWNWCPQDEALFHCEWEDISHGLELQRRGVPQRVNTGAVAESVTAHPLLLTRIHTLHADGRRERVRRHVTEAQASAAARQPEEFKPLIALDRESYYARVANRFNAIPGLPPSGHLREQDYGGCTGLADFWAVVERQCRLLPIHSRTAISALAFFLSDTVYKWPNAQLLQQIRAHERTLPARTLERFDNIVGWGTGAAFRRDSPALGRQLAFVVDRDERKWGTRIDGVEVRPPAALLALDPASTAIVVFSCFVEEITASVRALGPFAVLPAAEVVSGAAYKPLADVVGYFRDVERYYPVTFAAVCEEKAA